VVSIGDYAMCLRKVAVASAMSPLMNDWLDYSTWVVKFLWLSGFSWVMLFALENHVCVVDPVWLIDFVSRYWS